MWGLFVGLAIGVLQVVALRILIRMILGDKTSAKMIGALLLLVKIAVIVLILCLVASVSLTHLIWTAAGMVTGMVLSLVVIQLRRKNKVTGSLEDRKDNSDG